MLIYDHKMENSQMMFQISKYYVENLSNMLPNEENEYEKYIYCETTTI